MHNLLKPKELRFVNSCIKSGGNGTLAVKEAGITSDDNYVGVVANRMLRNDKILEAIKEQFEANGLSIDRIMRRLSHIIEKGKDSGSIQAIQVWGDLTGAFAPKQLRIMEQLQNIPKTPEEIDSLLESMRAASR